MRSKLLSMRNRKFSLHFRVTVLGYQRYGTVIFLPFCLFGVLSTIQKLDFILHRMHFNTLIIKSKILKYGYGFCHNKVD